VSKAHDHKPLPDAEATRRYFAKFERIIAHLHDVTAAARERDGPLAVAQMEIVEAYLSALANTFTALSYKHLMAHTVSNAMTQRLEIDRRDSGFPVYRELLQMANDMVQADHHLDGMPSRETLKAEMVDHILTQRTAPRALQFAMSQRIYFEFLRDGAMFFAQNHPQIVLLESTGGGDRRRKHYLIHWAVYDSQESRPVIYFMVVEDSGKAALPRDERRWPAVQSHLLAQSILALKLVTIATGFDKDFEDLHPKLLRRIHVGPMYSHAFTEQTGPLREVLAEAAGEPGLDWALGWTTETLVSIRSERQASGLFGAVEREVYELDFYGRTDAETGTSRIDRSLILPYRPYQVLADRDLAGLRGVHKYVVGPDGALLTGV